MVLARVVGNVVSTHKDPGVQDRKLLLVDRIDAETARGRGDFYVAVDSVGAGTGDVVLTVHGSSARMTQLTTGRPCDAAIMAIVEFVEKDGRIVYRKDEDVTTELD